MDKWINKVLCTIQWNPNQDIKKETIDTWNHPDVSQGSYVKEKKNPISRSCWLYDFIYIAISKRQNQNDGGDSTSC